MAKEKCSAPNLFRVHEPGDFHQLEDATFGVVLQTVPRMKPAGQHSLRVALRTVEIKQVKRTTGSENPQHFMKRLFPLVRADVMKHKRREYAIEGSFGIGQLI